MRFSNTLLICKIREILP